jgi:hypothetical protein
MDYCMRAADGAKSDAVQSLLNEGAFDWLIPALAHRRGAADRNDVAAEYNDKVKRAEKEKKVSGALKEERDGIGNIFSGEADAERDLGEGFTL